MSQKVNQLTAKIAKDVRKDRKGLYFNALTLRTLRLKKTYETPSFFK